MLQSLNDNQACVRHRPKSIGSWSSLTRFVSICNMPAIINQTIHLFIPLPFFHCLSTPFKCLALLARTTTPSLMKTQDYFIIKHTSIQGSIESHDPNLRLLFSAMSSRRRTLLKVIVLGDSGSAFLSCLSVFILCFWDDGFLLTVCFWI